MADIKKLLWSEVGTTAMKRSKIFGYIFVIFFSTCVGLVANDYMLGFILGGFWPIPLALAWWGKKVAFELDPSLKEDERKKKIEKIRNKPLPKSIQRDLEQLRKDQDALSKKLDKHGFDL